MMRLVRRPSFVLSVLAWGSVALLGLSASSARAQQKPVSQATEYSPYEQEAIDTALADRGLTIDKNPEGKKVRRIDTVRLEVLEPRDPGPELLKPIPIVSPLGSVVTKPMLNWLHVRSRDFVIRRELLLAEGDPYQQVLVDETARNMRAR